jgi:hypothetical protein
VWIQTPTVRDTPTDSPREGGGEREQRETCTHMCTHAAA